MNQKLKSIGRWILYLAVILTLVYFLEGWGLIGLLVFTLAFAAYRAWKSRDFLLFAMRQMETTIWGKPLDKDCWEKGEMKNTKLELTWGSKKMDWQFYINILLWPGIALVIIGFLWSLTITFYIGVSMLALYVLVKLEGKMKKLWRQG